jgi:hypothetical protein
MKSLDTVPYHSMAEKLVEILCQKTQNASPQFFRVLISYHLAKVASMMRVMVQSKDRGIIPVNLYAINLAASGQGKGHSTDIIEEQITNKFYNVFFDQTYPVVVEENLAKLAVKRANIKELDPDEQIGVVTKEFEALGPLLTAFDSGTTAAVKQMHHKLLMCEIGSMNFEMDEIGSNLLGNADILGTFLELFDKGKIKKKLTKNTKENSRNEEIIGNTPANLLLFGTPSKLLDGSKVEDEFYSFLETGYARRCMFGYTRTTNKNINMTPEDVYDALTDTSTNSFISDVSTKLGQLAGITNYNKVITISKPVSLLLIEYRQECERKAAALGEHEDILKAEISHRYFKTLKLAGTYAFIDGQSEVTEDNLYSAIKMTEESGVAFRKLLKRDRAYVKLAKYIANVGHEVTHADMTEDLPFYRGSGATKAEQMQLAIAWGYKNQIIIKKSYSSGIEFLTGETLKATDLSKMRLAYSTEWTENYKNVTAPFDKLHQLTQKDDLHWITHHLSEGHRHEEGIISGFNMVVIDVDDGVSVDSVKAILKDYVCMIYTTKRHTPAAHRFRIILPINYYIKLDSQDFKEFMANIFEWLPFEVDTATGQRSRKWMTFNGHYEYINENNPDAKLLDALEFIPKTAKNDERKKDMQTMKSLNNVERWFINNTGDGNRNNQLIRYAMMQADSGMAFDVIRNNVITLNDKLPDKLSDSELTSTILTSVSRAIAGRAAKTN